MVLHFLKCSYKYNIQSNILWAAVTINNKRTKDIIPESKTESLGKWKEELLHMSDLHYSQSTFV